ncbi:MAG: M48 family metalloprotease [Deltaproteobacteria bacterium]|nr:M48 family metalloprotease [Deltaproteobacteria bacterium]
MNRQRIGWRFGLCLAGLVLALANCKMVDLKRGDLGRQLTNVAQTAGKAHEESQKCQALKELTIAVEEETAIGGAIAVNYVSSAGGLMIDAQNPGASTNDLNRYLNRVGKNLAAQSARPNLDWTFGVVNAEGFNAFSAPGGYVFVTRGLLKRLQNEAQLAGVLAHEIAHITERHALNVYGAIKANQCTTAVAAGAAGELAGEFLSFKGALGSGNGFISLNDPKNLKLLTKLTDKVVDKITSQGYAHDDEFNADRVAVELMLSAGYQPSEYLKVLGMIPSDGGSFSNHPTNGDRQSKITAWKQQAAQQAKADPLSPDPDARDLKTVRLPDKLWATIR